MSTRLRIHIIFDKSGGVTSRVGNRAVNLLLNIDFLCDCLCRVCARVTHSNTWVSTRLCPSNPYSPWWCRVHSNLSIKWSHQGITTTSGFQIASCNRTASRFAVSESCCASVDRCRLVTWSISINLVIKSFCCQRNTIRSLSYFPIGVFDSLYVSYWLAIFARDAYCIFISCIDVLFDSHLSSVSNYNITSRVRCTTICSFKLACDNITTNGGMSVVEPLSPSRTSRNQICWGIITDNLIYSWWCGLGHSNFTVTFLIDRPICMLDYTSTCICTLDAESLAVTSLDILSDRQSTGTSNDWSHSTSRVGSRTVCSS